MCVTLLDYIQCCLMFDRLSSEFTVVRYAWQPAFVRFGFIPRCTLLNVSCAFNCALDISPALS